MCEGGSHPTDRGLLRQIGVTTTGHLRATILATSYGGIRMFIRLATAPWARFIGLAALALQAACVAAPNDGLAPSGSANTTVAVDFFHRPLPNIPLPNDLATRFDANSATQRRLNASMLAPTFFERLTRELVDELDGWGIFAPISVPFTGPIEVRDIIDHHHANRQLDDDVVYVIDITRGSPGFGAAVELDAGQGNFPVVLEKLDSFWEADPRGDTNTLLFEEHDEDANGNGKLDPGEDDDLDGRLDKPNYLPTEQRKHTDMNLAERADALMTFYERETDTLLLRPLQPLRERTTYAVVVTRRLRDNAGNPVGSPFAFINHTAQNTALEPLADALAAGKDIFGDLQLSDIAFTWTFTTGSTSAELIAVRDGLYGHGVQAHLADEFPATLSKIHNPWSAKPKFAWESQLTFSAETFLAVNSLLTNFGQELISVKGEFGARLLAAMRYVDFHALGTYASPQLMQRVNANGDYVSYNEMVWPPDVHRKKVAARAEEVPFWLTVPRREVIDAANAARGIGKGKPAPLAIIGHGYTSTRFEVLVYHAFFARHGIACLAIDNASHGLPLPDEYKELVPIVLDGIKAKGMGTAILDNRMWDQDADGQEDSGADFWTAYTFHTRDNVRQTAVDYMQLMRVLRTWDGNKKWPFDANGDGDAGNDVAGDFNGDGIVDVGGPDALITMTGSSLGGIMSAVMAGTEPHLAAAVPIAGGAGLGDVGIRSIQGGVKEAVQLRMMGPIYIGYPVADGSVEIRQVVPRLNKTEKMLVATLPKTVVDQLKNGASVRIDNEGNDEYDCALVRPDGSFRVAVASDAFGDADKAQRQRHVMRFYPGNPFVLGEIDERRHRACALKADAKALHTVDSFGADVAFHLLSKQTTYQKGEPLTAIAEGLGLHRARPETRRFMAFAQMILDPGDPATYARFATGGLQYATGEQVQTHTIVWHNVGDMNVPVSTGVSIARAAGLLDMKTRHPAWGNRTLNQVLIDTHVLEAVDTIPRFKAPNGSGVLLDPEDLSQSASKTTGVDVFAPGPNATFARGDDGYYVPRLSPPLHDKAVFKDAGGGWSGLFVPLVKPTGQHDPEQPGSETDRLRKACVAAAKDATGAEDPAKKQACQAPTQYFDQGSLVYEMLAYYLASGGTRFSLDACQIQWTCKDIPPPPAERKP